MSRSRPKAHWRYMAQDPDVVRILDNQTGNVLHDREQRCDLSEI